MDPLLQLRCLEAHRAVEAMLVGSLFESMRARVPAPTLGDDSPPSAAAEAMRAELEEALEETARERAWDC
jgi:hypothetical protein